MHGRCALVYTAHLFIKITNDSFLALNITNKIIILEWLYSIKNSNYISNKYYNSFVLLTFPKYITHKNECIMEYWQNSKITMHEQFEKMNINKIISEKKNRYKKYHMDNISKQYLKNFILIGKWRILYDAFIEKMNNIDNYIDNEIFYCFGLFLIKLIKSGILRHSKIQSFIEYNNENNNNYLNSKYSWQILIMGLNAYRVLLKDWIMNSNLNVLSILRFDLNKQSDLDIFLNIDRPKKYLNSFLKQWHRKRVELFKHSNENEIFCQLMKFNSDVTMNLLCLANMKDGIDENKQFLFYLLCKEN